jgi:endonuclease/exonuclease/phosphatase family metal-dependent hydrolase
MRAPGATNRPQEGREPALARWRAWLAWVLALFFALWALMRLLGLDRGYPLVPVVAFTPYIAGLSLLAVAAIAVLRTRVPLALAALASVALVAVTVPRAIGGGGAPEPADGEPLTVMTANLRFGEADAERVVDLVREGEIDVLSVQELTGDAVHRLRAAGLERLLEHRVTPAEEGGGGGGIYATEPLLPSGDLGRGTGGFRMPSARLEVNGRPLAVVSVHPVPPTVTNGVQRWRAALDALPATGGDEELGLLLGDFNATLDHRELRQVLARGYVDAADVTGDGLTTTWSNGRWPPLTIDHLLVDERVHVEGTEVHELPGSDHDAVIADLVLPGAED